MISKKYQNMVLRLAFAAAFLIANHPSLIAGEKEIGSDHFSDISRLLSVHLTKRNRYSRVKGESLEYIDDKFIKCDFVALTEKVAGKEIKREEIVFKKGTNTVIHKRVFFRIIKDDELEYSAYLDSNDKLKKYAVVLPQKVKDQQPGKKVFISEERYYSGEGKMTGRFLSEVWVDYNESSARFYEFRYGEGDELISRKEGDAPFHEYEENSDHNPPR